VGKRETPPGMHEENLGKPHVGKKGPDGGPKKPTVGEKAQDLKPTRERMIAGPN